MKPHERPTRVCKRCETEKPVEKFTVTNTDKNSGKKYYAWTCKACRKQMRAETGLPLASRRQREQCRQFNQIARWPAPESFA